MFMCESACVYVEMLKQLVESLGQGVHEGASVGVL